MKISQAQISWPTHWNNFQGISIFWELLIVNYHRLHFNKLQNIFNLLNVCPILCELSLCVSELVFDCLFSVISFAKNSIADRYWHRRYEMASNVLMPFQQILELNTWELFLQQSTVLLLDLFTVGRCHSRNHELKSFHFFFAPLAILIGWSPGFLIVFSFIMDYWIHISLLTLTNVLCIANVSLLCSLNTKNVWSVLCIILPIYRTFSLHNDSPLENWSFANVIKYTEWFYVVLFLGNAFFLSNFGFPSHYTHM